MTTLEKFFSSSAIIRGVYAKSVYIENVSTCAENTYIESTSAGSNGGKYICIENAYIKASYGKFIYIENSCIENTCDRVAYIGDTSVERACIKSVCIKEVFNGCTCVRNIYAGSVGAIEHSKIYLQFFQILNLKLFGTRLETGVGVGW